MLTCPTPVEEAERLSSLESLNLLSTPREKVFDQITRLARATLNTEIALISLIDKDRQWFKSKQGLAASETPRNISFCGHAIHQDDLFIVEDASNDDRFHDNPLVTGPPNIRLYAGRSLKNADGFRIGTLCVISGEPRKLSGEEKQSLDDLGSLTELAISSRELSTTQKDLIRQQSTEQRDRLIDSVSGLWNAQGLSELFHREINRAKRKSEPVCIASIRLNNYEIMKHEFNQDLLDSVIGRAANCISEASRTYDVVARFDEDEFIVLMPGIPSAIVPVLGSKFANQFNRYGRMVLTPANPINLSARIGIEQFNPNTGGKAQLDVLVERARSLVLEQGASDETIYATEQDADLAHFALT